MAANDFQSLMDEVSADYRRSLPAKFAELDALCAQLTPGNLEILKRELHTIAGTAKTLGLPALTDAARAAEVFFDTDFTAEDGSAPAAQPDIGRLLDSLRKAVT